MTVMTAMLTAQADDTTYSYLVFETADGTKTSVPVSSLTISVSGTTLKAGSQTFDLNTLSKMYFSTSDETATGIEEINSAAIEEATDIYDLQGHKVSKEQMRKGVYIVKTKSRTYKMVVR